MEIKEEQIRLISKKYGDAFYILDTECFKKNYNDLQAAMRKYYKKHISLIHIKLIIFQDYVTL